MKIFKLFVCLSLILSISLINSFAAISVSDGSAFVTKAEFAADLNNLSNRMSSLENSLDAKIDSLVSSYLSRNGIWNGEKQTKIASDISMGTGITGPTVNFNNTVTLITLNQKLITTSKAGLARFRISANKRLFAYEIFDRSALKSNYSVGQFSISIFFNKEEISDLAVGSWYAATDSMSKILSDNLTVWNVASLQENSYYSNSTADQVAVSLSKPAFQEYIYFFIEKDINLYANVVGIGSLWGQPMKNKELNWRSASINSFEYDVNIY